jgi:hypothetical protein
MNLDEIRRRVDKIAKMGDSGDDEGAHCEEDVLFRDFIRYIQLSAPEPFASKAKEVLRTLDLDFSRFCS